jgi:hypothetical protein
MSFASLPAVATLLPDEWLDARPKASALVEVAGNRILRRQKAPDLAFNGTLNSSMSFETS